jgi:hypothetical protein
VNRSVNSQNPGRVARTLQELAAQNRMLVSNKRWDDAFALHSGGMQESNFSVQLIEREIELENIDPFFAENAEKPVLG